MVAGLWGLTVSVAMAGTPWIHPAGSGYAKASLQRFASSGFVMQDGGVAAEGATVGWTSSLYAEAGLGRGLQVVAALPFVGSRSVVSGASFVNRGWGDSVVGLSQGTTLAQNFPVAWTVRMRLPLYDNGRLADLGAAGARFPALGEGQVDLDALGSAGGGWSVAGQGGWWMVELGGRCRSEWWLGDHSEPDRELGNAVLARAQTGWSPVVGGRSRGWLFAEVSTVKAVRPAPFHREQVELGTGGALAIGPVWALELGGSALVWTAAAAPGWALHGGLSHRGPWRSPQEPRGG